MTLDELIAALEKATGPSRELDWAIAYSLGLGTEIEREVYTKHGAKWCTDDPALRMTPLQKRQGCHFSYSRPGREGRRIRTSEQFVMAITGPQPLRDAARYTVSFDATLTLARNEAETRSMLMAAIRAFPGTCHYSKSFDPWPCIKAMLDVALKARKK